MESIEECPIEADFFHSFYTNKIQSIRELYWQKNQSAKRHITYEEFYRNHYDEVQELLNKWWNTLSEKDKREHVNDKIHSLECIILACNRQIGDYHQFIEESLDTENSLSIPQE